MNQEIIGKFIKKLREEKDLTQEELAKILKIGREAVSKWERGKTTPDVATLTLLSDFFDVSINEILIGERNTQKDVTLELYKAKTKLQGSLKKALLTIILSFTTFALTFFAYYFANFYKTTHVYLLSGSSENFSFSNGIFVKTAERMYLNLGEIKNETGLEVDRVTLYYTEDGEEKLIVARNTQNIAIKDYAGYEEYFEISKLDLILNNLYLRIEYSENQEDIKLKVIEDYVNDKFVLEKFPPMIKERTLVPKRQTSDKSKTLIERMKKKFIKKGNEYIYETEENEIKKRFTYRPEDINLLRIIISIDDETREEYTYFLDYEDLTYVSYIKNSLNYQATYFNEEYRCDLGSCKDFEKKKDEFWNIVNNTLDL